MASDKIINRILQSAKSDAQKIIDEANQKALLEKQYSKKETQQKIKDIENRYRNDIDEYEKTVKLNTGLQNRKDILKVKQSVIREAFEQAKKDIKKIPDDIWYPLIETIVLEATVSDTEYIKATKNDIHKFRKHYKNEKSFLDYLNKELRKRGHKKGLKLDETPARFEDGIMLVGEYSDVNASFDVLIDNIKEYIEYDVAKILFNSEEDNA